MDRNWKLGDDLYPQDNILDGLTFDDIILAFQNENDIINAKDEESRDAAAYSTFRRLVRERKEDADYIFEHNFAEIMNATLGITPETEENMPLTPEQREAFALEIINWLQKHEMWQDVTIYTNGKCWRTSDKERKTFRYNGEPFVFEADPKDYFEYVREPNILSMSFEGPLYELLNYDGGELASEFLRLFEAHGLYYELGNAWNLTACDWPFISGSIHSSLYHALQSTQE